MLERLEAIRDNVGEYQPILYDPASANRLSAIIRANGDRETTRTAVQNIDGPARLNLDTLNSALEQTALPASAITMADIRSALTEPGLLPDGWTAEHRGGPHWTVTRPDGSSQLVTTDLDAYDYGGANVAWFGPGSPWWPDCRHNILKISAADVVRQNTPSGQARPKSSLAEITAKVTKLATRSELFRVLNNPIPV